MPPAPAAAQYTVHACGLCMPVSTYGIFLYLWRKTLGQIVVDLWNKKVHQFTYGVLFLLFQLQTS